MGHGLCSSVVSFGRPNAPQWVWGNDPVDQRGKNVAVPNQQWSWWVINGCILARCTEEENMTHWLSYCSTLGLEEEACVPFHEHIFLEKHLEEGFPRQGPVRHFMELVVAGLSRNPYLTVQQKKEHISWFRDYFHQKQEVLEEADVHLNWPLDNCIRFQHLLNVDT